MIPTGARAVLGTGRAQGQAGRAYFWQRLRK
jgi:hypothetical protein